MGFRGSEVRILSSRPIFSMVELYQRVARFLSSMRWAIQTCWLNQASGLHTEHRQVLEWRDAMFLEHVNIEVEVVKPL